MDSKGHKIPIETDKKMPDSETLRRRLELIECIRKYVSDPIVEELLKLYYNYEK